MYFMVDTGNTVSGSLSSHYISLSVCYLSITTFCFSFSLSACSLFLSLSHSLLSVSADLFSDQLSDASLGARPRDSVVTDDGLKKPMTHSFLLQTRLLNQKGCQSSIGLGLLVDIRERGGRVRERGGGGGRGG